VRGREIREGQEEVPEVSLGVDQDGGNPVDRGLLDQRQAEAGLAAARHADAHRVRHEVARVVEEEIVRAPACGEVVSLPEVEDPELLEVHAGKLSAYSSQLTARWSPAIRAVSCELLAVSYPEARIFSAPCSTQCASTRRIRYESEATSFSICSGVP